MLTNVSSDKQNDWMGRLVNIEANQHIGAWFEIMLYGWLQEHFVVQVEPKVLGNFPDFVITFENNYLAIEARAFLKTPEERERKVNFDRIWSLLGSIEMPFLVKLKIKRLGVGIETANFIQKVTKWLISEADQNLNYQDNLGNVIELSAKPKPALKKLSVTSSLGLRVNPDVLRAPLKEKANQHTALRKAGYPYIIAIFLEPTELSAEEIVSAWIGKTIIVYNINTNQVIEEKFDQSGLHYFSHEITHKSVTGTLVFKAYYDGPRKSRYLKCWYVQNPHANVSVDPTVLPVESRFVVVGNDVSNFLMKWL